MQDPNLLRAVEAARHLRELEPQESITPENPFIDLPVKENDKVVALPVTEEDIQTIEVGERTPVNLVEKQRQEAELVIEEA